MNQLSRSIAIDFGQSGVRCNTIVTGLIRSTPEINARLQNEALADGFRQITAGKRFGIPSDIAHAVAFLCTEQAEYINGASLAVDGGMTARLAMPAIRESPNAGSLVWDSTIQPA
jgi:NAD(P)-dependent dehydrogenase (short-subunit alcohol dehydrogenase family)